MNTTNDDTVIPVRLQQAAAEIAAICRKYNMRSVEARLSPREFNYSDLMLHWQQGRHGADSDQAKLTFTKKIVVDIDAITDDGVDNDYCN